MAKDCGKRRRGTRSDLKNHDESTTTTPSVVNEIDIISTLPDCLLCHILSFLPGKTTSVVATTSVLSRRWRYVWKDLQDFRFIQSSLCFPDYCTAKSPFFASVKTFLSLRTARGFRKFQLSCHIKEEELSTVKSWVETAIGSNLEEVHFQLSVDSGRNLVMPDTIFNCTKLVNLFFGTCGQIVTVLNRSSYHLPSLKIFYLVIESSNNLEALLSGCPVLETLKLVINHICPNPIKKETIRVVSSSLKSLNIRACYKGAIIEELEIDTSSLEELCLTLSGKLEKLSARNLHKVETADLHFSSANGGYSLMELLNEIRNASDLSLYPSLMDSVALPIRDPMEFNHLQKLTVDYFDTTLVMDLLGKCHLLKDLTFFWHEDERDRLPWREPTDVPNCVASYLESVSVFVHYGSKKDTGFLTYSYIIQKGLILKKVKIWVLGWGFTDLAREVSLVPTGSKMCQVEYEVVTSLEGGESAVLIEASKAPRRGTYRDVVKIHAWWEVVKGNQEEIYFTLSMLSFLF